jgi:hypothetical protein
MYGWRYSSTILNVDSFTPVLLYFCGIAPSTHCMASWVGLKSSLDIKEKRKISCPYQESNPNSLFVQPVA